MARIFARFYNRALIAAAETLKTRHWHSSRVIVNERKPILELIVTLGYGVSVHRVNGVIEMHAVKLSNPLSSACLG
jgi:hypothetical protein